MALAWAGRLRLTLGAKQATTPAPGELKRMRSSGSKLLGALALVAAAFATPAGAQEGRLVLYTSQPNTDAQQTIDAFKAKYPKVEVTFVRDGTPRVLAKLRAEFEAGQPQPDLLLIADAVTMAGLKAEGRLLAHDKADVAAYAAGLFDTDRTWFSTKLITTGIVYNTKAPFKPTSWADLAKPEAKGLVIMPSPLASGAALIHAAALTGTLDGGWAYYEQLKANGAVAAQGNGDVLKQVAGGEKLYGMIVDYMPIREKAKGAPLEFVFPTDGVSAIGEPVAILKTAKNQVAAKAFVDFLLSKEGQELAAKQGYIPAHPDVALPPGYPARSAIKILALDAAKALADEAINKKKFGEIFGQ
jgi:iron(III) transport system substrate-binding protein